VNVIIAGSRTFEDYEYLKGCISTLDYIEIDEIVSGGAKGADELGERYAEEKRLPCRIIPADWDEYGNAAGPIRNEIMSEYADCLILFYDGQSKGSTNMLNCMRKLKKPIYVFFMDKSGSFTENGIVRDFSQFVKDEGIGRSVDDIKQMGPHPDYSV
jgi:hypothetical protein